MVQIKRRDGSKKGKRKEEIGKKKKKRKEWKAGKLEERY